MCSSAFKQRWIGTVLSVMFSLPFFPLRTDASPLPLPVVSQIHPVGAHPLLEMTSMKWDRSPGRVEQTPHRASHALDILFSGYRVIARSA